MIILNSVSKNNVKDFSLYIKTGEMICIYDDDSNKINSLSKVLRGEEKPDKGVIRYLDKGSYSAEFPEKHFGFVFKKNILLDNRTIEENLKYIMRIREMDMNGYISRIGRILDIVDLKIYKNRKVTELLNHQLVRANIAQAILNYPPVLILEEPLQDIDEVNSLRIIHLLKRLNRFSMTVILLSSSSNKTLGRDVRFIRIANTYPEKKKGYYA